MHMNKQKLKSGLNLTLFELFSRMVAWLDHQFLGVGHTASIQRLLSKMFRILETRGKPEAIRYVKRVRLELLKVLEDSSSERLQSQERNAIKFPKDLKFLKTVPADKFYPMIRLVLSVLAVFRFLRGDGIPSFKSITDGPAFSEIPQDYLDGIIPFLRSLGQNPRYFGVRPKKLNFKKFKMTVKSGPKGHALWTSYLDLLSLPEPLKEAVGVLGGPRLREDMSNYLVFIPFVADYLAQYLGKTGVSLRRLSMIRDKEGKTREIAILDYYSQQALRPLHQYLFRILSRIPQDCTFDHGRLLEKLTPDQGSSFHSIDLSTATDRFPIELQSAILEVMFGPEYARSWKTVMVGFPFSYKDMTVSYTRGNPMGAYSSWAAFSLAHHYLVYLACLAARVSWKRCPYMMLGDDIVIANDRVASEYLRLLERFDIPFGKEKSHSSPYLFEFSKRFVHCGNEISPFPLAGLYENRNNWLLAIGTIFEETHRKRWEPRIDIFQSSLAYMKTIGYSQRYISKRADKLMLVLGLREAFAGTRTMASVLKLAAFQVHGQEFSDDLQSFGDEIIVPEVLIKSFRNLFRSSFDQITSKNNKKPFGLIAEELTIRATMLFEMVEDPFLLIRSCPILQVYGEFEELYLKLNRNPMDDNALLRGDYRSFFMEVSIPSGDESFYMRRKDVLQLATSRLADQILDTMRPLKGNLQMLHPMAY